MKTWLDSHRYQRVTLGLDTADREGHIGARDCWSGGSHWGSTLLIGRVTLGLYTADREGHIGARQCWSGGSHWGSTLLILRQQISSVSVTVYIYVSVSWWWHTQTSRRKGNKSTQYSQWCNLDQWQPEDSQPITTHH